MIEGEGIEGYNHNEIYPSKDVKTVSLTKRVLSLIVLILLALIIVSLVVATILNSKALSIIRNPRIIILPVSFALIYFALTFKRKSKTKMKKELADIIAGMTQEKITIKDILDVCVPDHDGDRYVKKEITKLVIDVLWDGLIQTHKYIIDQECLVRIDKEVEQVSYAQNN